MMQAKKMMPQQMGMTKSEMPMINGIIPALCNMSCRMEKDSMICEMKPMGAITLPMLEACCDTLNQMCEMGAPITVTCCNMTMMVKVECTMKRDGMICKMMPMNGMTPEMMKCCCDCMTELCEMGMPMCVMCCGVPVVICCMTE